MRPPSNIAASGLRLIHLLARSHSAENRAHSATCAFLWLPIQTKCEVSSVAVEGNDQAVQTREVTEVVDADNQSGQREDKLKRSASQQGLRLARDDVADFCNAIAEQLLIHVCRNAGEDSTGESHCRSLRETEDEPCFGRGGESNRDGNVFQRRMTRNLTNREDDHFRICHFAERRARSRDERLDKLFPNFYGDGSFTFGDNFGHVE